MNLYKKPEFSNVSMNEKERVDAMNQLLELDMLLVMQICRYDSFLLDMKTYLEQFSEITGSSANVVGCRGKCDGYRHKTLRVKRNDQSHEQMMLKFSLSKSMSDIYSSIVKFEQASGQEKQEMKSRIGVLITSIIWIGDVERIIGAHTKDKLKIFDTIRKKVQRILKEHNVIYRGAGLDFLTRPHKFSQEVQEACFNEVSDLLGELREKTGIQEWHNGEEFKILGMLKDINEQSTQIKQKLLESVERYINQNLRENYANLVENYYGGFEELQCIVFEHILSVLKRYLPANALTTFVRSEMSSILKRATDQQHLVNVTSSFLIYRSKIHSIVSKIEDEMELNTSRAAAIAIDEIRALSTTLKDISVEQVINVIEFQTVKSNYDDTEYEILNIEAEDNSESFDMHMMIQHLIKKKHCPLKQHAIAYLVNEEIDGFEGYILSEEKLSAFSKKDIKQAEAEAKVGIGELFGYQPSNEGYVSLIEQQINPILAHFIAEVLVENGHSEYTKYLNDEAVPSGYSRYDINEKKQSARAIIEDFKRGSDETIEVTRFVDYTDVILSQFNPVMGHFIATVLCEQGEERYKEYMDISLIPSYLDSGDIKDYMNRAAVIINNYRQSVN